jgi:hypothetical protein
MRDEDKAGPSHAEPYPLVIPPEEMTEDWELYMAVAGPIEIGRCFCHAVCCAGCEDGTGCTCDPEKTENG